MKTTVLALSALAALPALSADPDPKLKAQLERLEYKFEVSPRGQFKLSFKNGATRSHLITIDSQVSEVVGVPIRQLFALAYTAPAATGRIPTPILRMFLTENGTRRLGAWEITESDGRESAFFTVKIQGDASDLALKAAMTTVIECADEMEAKLTGKDDY